jgi:hypothetical protein
MACLNYIFCECKLSRVAIVVAASFLKFLTLSNAQTGVPPNPPTVTAQLPSGKSVQGVLQQEAGQTVLKTDSDTKYTLSNSDALPKLAEPFPLHVDLKPRGGKYYLEIGKADIKSVGQWRSAFKRVVDTNVTPQLKTLEDRVEELDKVVTPNLAKPTEEQDLSAVVTVYKKAEKVLDELYPTVQKDREVQSALLELKKNLQEERRRFFHNKLAKEGAFGDAHNYIKDASLVEKRFYRLNDNYRPEIYAMIRRLCSSCVAIVRKGKDVPDGSGVVIAENLVLTCKHNIAENCAESFESSDYAVWFDFEEKRWPPPVTTVVFDCKEKYRSDKLDFVILEIRPRNRGQNFDPTPIPVSKTRVMRWTPIFLVGHPQGLRRTVHDGAWVLFPYELRSNQEWGDLESDIAGDFVDWRADGKVEAKQEAGFVQADEFMVDSYGDFNPNGKTVYRYMPQGPNGQPSIGAECDTFSGDSGAPAILRETGELVGILYKGLSDIPGQSAATSERRPKIFGSASAKSHELILPISVIVDELGNSTCRQLGIQIDE